MGNACAVCGQLAATSVYVDGAWYHQGCLPKMAPEEALIEGVLHRLEGKTYVPMTARELTARLLEARGRPYVPTLPIIPVRQFDLYRQPWVTPPVFARETELPGVTITCGVAS